MAFSKQFRVNYDKVLYSLYRNTTRISLWMEVPATIYASEQATLGLQDAMGVSPWEFTLILMVAPSLSPAIPADFAEILTAKQRKFSR
jgi:hypothetical protein